MSPAWGFLSEIAHPVSTVKIHVLSVVPNYSAMFPVHYSFYIKSVCLMLNCIKVIIYMSLTKHVHTVTHLNQGRKKCTLNQLRTSCISKVCLHLRFQKINKEELYLCPEIIYRQLTSENQHSIFSNGPHHNEDFKHNIDL